MAEKERVMQKEIVSARTRKQSLLIEKRKIQWLKKREERKKIMVEEQRRKKV